MKNQLGFLFFLVKNAFSRYFFVLFNTKIWVIL